jgi:hypothetical protein
MWQRPSTSPRIADSVTEADDDVVDAVVVVVDTEPTSLAIAAAAAVGIASTVASVKRAVADSWARVGARTAKRWVIAVVRPSTYFGVVGLPTLVLLWVGHPAWKRLLKRAMKGETNVAMGVLKEKKHSQLQKRPFVHSS